MGSRREWSRFIRDNIGLLSQLGIPEECYETMKSFHYFLMHGAYPGCHFSLPPHSQMDDATRGLVSRLVEEYFKAGFGDPGVDVLSWDEVQKLKRGSGED